MLSLSTRDIGHVTVIQCAGRVVVGEPSESLRNHVTHLLRDRRELVLHLGGVGFIDSTGLGTIVRLLTSTRQARGDLKLCAVTPAVQALLKITTTRRLFDIHDSEENAIAAFYRGTAPTAAVPAKGPSVLCIHKSADVLAYLRELLRHAGYDVHTTSGVGDALLLLRVAHPQAIVVGHGAVSSSERQAALDAACAGLPRIALSEDFSTRHAGEAAEALLEEIRANLPNPASNS